MTESSNTTETSLTALAEDVAKIAEAYRGGMRLLPASVCLITASRGDELGGMIATAVTSVSAEPPTLLVCVNRSASMFELIQQTGRFCVNVLTTEALPMVDIFSRSDRRAERFQSGEWTTSPLGTPVCAQAMVSFECRLANVVDWHSHGIFLGEVTSVLHPSAGAAPLLYMDRQFHALSELTAEKI